MRPGCSFTNDHEIHPQPVDTPSLNLILLLRDDGHTINGGLTNSFLEFFLFVFIIFILNCFCFFFVPLNGLQRLSHYDDDDDGVTDLFVAAPIKM